MQKIKRHFQGFASTLGQHPAKLIRETAGDVSQTSGRGVGLAAIQASAQRLGGHARIEQGANGGTVLTVEWPRSHEQAA